MKYCVIMAGGIGTRFWPISRTAQPKQFLDILGTGKSFIRATFERFLPLVPAENFLVVTSADYAPLVLEQLPELRPEQVLGEPLGRNTGPCIAWAAYRLLAADPDAEMVVTPADHLILNEPEFHKVVDEGFAFIRDRDAMMTIGIRPSRPDTGYGYIQVDLAQSARGEIRKVKTFTEKPSLELAEAFVASGEFFWNSGIFIWKASTIREALTRFLPEMAQLFAGVEGWGTPAEQGQVDVVYSELRPVSIDVGVMERAANVYVRCSDFGWSDLGTWGSLYQNSAQDDNGNVLPPGTLAYDTKGCIVKLPEGMLAVVEGLRDYIVAQSDGALMICPKANEQNVKRFIDDLKYTHREEYI